MTPHPRELGTISPFLALPLLKVTSALEASAGVLGMDSGQGDGRGTPITPFEEAKEVKFKMPGPGRAPADRRLPVLSAPRGIRKLE